MPPVSSGDRRRSARESGRTPWRRPFRPRRWALLLLIAAGLAVAADLFLPAGPFPPRERRVVLVERGQTLRGVSEELSRVGVLRGTLGFQVLARLMRLDRSIKAGQYSFRLGITVPALLRAFARGMSGLNLITIQEGLTFNEISVLLSNRLGVPMASFDSLAHSRAFLDSLGVSAPTIEGYLAPNSYEFLPGTSPEVAFRTMANRQNEILLKASVGRDSLPLGLKLYEVLTLASIVEAEAQVDEERPRIARVYLNRLQMGMRMQADPTVSYGLGLGPRSHLFLRQLKRDTPFNTYLNEGLPPGPICNPGVASIRAVIDPLPDVKDLYFVARGHGRHLFAETYQQHLRNIAFVRTVAPKQAESESTHALVDTTRSRSAAAAVARSRAAAADTARARHAAAADTTRARHAAPDTAHARPAVADTAHAKPRRAGGVTPAASPKNGSGTRAPSSTKASSAKASSSEKPPSTIETPPKSKTAKGKQPASNAKSTPTTKGAVADTSRAKRSSTTSVTTKRTTQKAPADTLRSKRLERPR